ncbi:MAG TPA: MBL fold metallo-hydrolase [Polyangiaceae bacterium]|nr:MBL fold metallo-hydrolase [Polyangiaceae bacterium]
MKTAELREVADGVHAYLQRGGWGYSNAGLVTDSGASLLVDTLYDLALTERMLSTLRRMTPGGRIDTVVNTHANGDHCWGNQLVGGARIVSSRAAAEEMLELSPKRMAALVDVARVVSRSGSAGKKLLSLLDRLGVPKAAAVSESAGFVVECFGAFDFRDVTLRLPDETFEGRLELRVGDKRVELVQVGPAHTKGDVIVHLPDQRVAFTGDILFIGSHPIAWEGPVANWVAACDRLLALDIDLVVPGHGPVTTKLGVQRTKEYWQDLVATAKRGTEAGASADEIAREIFLRGYDGWSEASRLAVNLDTICRELAGDRSRRDPFALMAKMARLERLRAEMGHISPEDRVVASPVRR